MANNFPTQSIGGSDLIVPRIALGCMGMAGVGSPSEVGPENVRRAVAAFEAALDARITLFDHADIYGATACESVFKSCLEAVPGAREKIVIATKCGIRPGHYNLSRKHILESIDGSLSRMGIDYVDLYQMHRPDMLTHPRETASALRELLKSGKVRHVGVSNYYPEQVRALQVYLEEIPIISNQIELSLLHVGQFYEGWRTDGCAAANDKVGSGVLDQCMAQNITPLAWGPLGGSWLGGHKEAPTDHPIKAIIDGVVAELKTQGEKYGATPGQIAIAWLLAHPSGIIPLVGSNSPEHIREAVDAANVQMEREDWYRLFAAAWGRSVP